jgi:hypothetical protein
VGEPLGQQLVVGLEPGLPAAALAPRHVGGLDLLGQGVEADAAPQLGGLAQGVQDVGADGGEFLALGEQAGGPVLARGRAAARGCVSRGRAIRRGRAQEGDWRALEQQVAQLLGRAAGLEPIEDVAPSGRSGSCTVRAWGSVARIRRA